MTSTNYGLNDRLRYYELVLDSLDNGTGDGTQMSNNINYSPLDWPLFFIQGKKPFTKIAAIKVIEVQFPFSYYVFNSKNNTFILTETTNPTPVTVTLPIGNYTAPQMATILGNSLTAVSPGGHTYFVVYDSVTQKFTFYNGAAVNDPFSFTFGLPTNSGNTNPRLWIGFPGGVTSSQGINPLPYGNYLTSPNVVNVTGPNYVYLNSTKLGPAVDMYLPKGAFNLGGGNAGPQIAKIPVNVQPGGVCYWQDPDPQKYWNLQDQQNLLSADFYFTLGNTTSQIPLQFNGGNFSIKIGMLLYEDNIEQTQSGTFEQNRVVKRVRRV